MDSAFKRHKIVYTILRPLVVLYCKIVFNYKVEKPVDMEGPFILIPNHVSVYDMLFAAIHFKPHMYFVASEHSMRGGFASKLLSYFIEPIVRPKATVGASTVMKMRKHLKAGHNVCLFAEGEQSSNGTNRKILKATAPVVKMMGAKLVTFKIHGGYFTAPRWGKGVRRGEMSGEIVNVYSPAELKAMTDDELDAVINGDIFEDAYAENAEKKIAYKGKNLAEGIEYQLVVCPKCGKLNSIKSGGNEFFCDCGLKGKYDEYGMISGDGFDFTTITQWDEWQKQVLSEMDFDDNTVICSEADQVIKEIRSDHTMEIVSTGDIALTTKELRVGDWSIELSELSKYDIIAHGYLLLSTKDGRYFEIKNKEHKYAGQLYLLLIDKFVRKYEDASV